MAAASLSPSPGLWPQFPLFCNSSLGLGSIRCLPPSSCFSASGGVVVVPLMQSLQVITSFPALFIPWMIFPRDATYQFPEIFATHYLNSAVLTPFLLALWALLFCDLFPEITFQFVFFLFFHQFCSVSPNQAQNSSFSSSFCHHWK